MDFPHSQPWFDIAQKVDALLGSPGVKERFREKVQEAAAEWLRRFDEKRQREEARSEAVKRKGVPYGSGRLPADPKDGSFHWLEDFHDGKPPLEAWLSAELSPDLDPDSSPPLPVPAKREVSLAERYAVLAAVWDALWKGDKKINLWADDDFCREGMCYWSLVHADTPGLCTAELSDRDAVIVQTWLADVEADQAAVATVEKPLRMEPVAAPVEPAAGQGVEPAADAQTNGEIMADAAKYSLQDLLRDLRRRDEHRKRAEPRIRNGIKPAANDWLNGLERRSWNSSAAKIEREIDAKPGVERHKTFCRARREPWNADTLEMFCAQAAERESSTLAEFLQRDVAAGFFQWDVAAEVAEWVTGVPSPAGTRKQGEGNAETGSTPTADTQRKGDSTADKPIYPSLQALLSDLEAQERAGRLAMFTPDPDCAARNERLASVPGRLKTLCSAKSEDGEFTAASLRKACVDAAAGRTGETSDDVLALSIEAGLERLDGKSPPSPVPKPCEGEAKAATGPKRTIRDLYDVYRLGQEKTFTLADESDYREMLYILQRCQKWFPGELEAGAIFNTVDAITKVHHLRKADVWGLDLPTFAQRLAATSQAGAKGEGTGGAGSGQPIQEGEIMALPSDVGGQPPYKRGEDSSRIAAEATPAQIHQWADDGFQLWMSEVRGNRRVEQFIDCCYRLAAVAEQQKFDSTPLLTFIGEIRETWRSDRIPSELQRERAWPVVERVDLWATAQIVRANAVKSQTQDQEPVNAGSTPAPEVKRFRVALSFPGEYRGFIGKVAESLAGSLGRDRVFYDRYYEAELARLDLDTYLQGIYHDNSDLIAVFLCSEYERKDWCGLEWRAIRDLIKRRTTAEIMPFRFDNTSIPGLFSIDGYVEIRQRLPTDVASLILDRLKHNDQQT